MDDIKPVSPGTAPESTTPQAGGMVSPTAAASPTMEDTISSEAPSEPVAPPAAPEPASAPAEQPDNTAAPTLQNPMAAPQKGSPKKKHTGLVIVIATIVALALAGAAYYAYMKNMKHDDVKTTQSSTKTTTATVTPAKAADVDQTSQALDKSLATTNDAKDFAATDLTDATLGL